MLSRSLHYSVGGFKQELILVYQIGPKLLINREINFPQSWTCFPGMYMLMFPPRRRYHHNLRSTDGLTILANWLEIVTILVHYQPSYNTSHTIKPSDPQLLAVGHWGLRAGTLTL